MNSEYCPMRWKATTLRMSASSFLKRLHDFSFHSSLTMGRAVLSQFVLNSVILKLITLSVESFHHENELLDLATPPTLCPTKAIISSPVFHIPSVGPHSGCVFSGFGSSTSESDTSAMFVVVLRGQGRPQGHHPGRQGHRKSPVDYKAKPYLPVHNWWVGLLIFWSTNILIIVLQLTALALTTGNIFRMDMFKISGIFSCPAGNYQISY